MFILIILPASVKTREKNGNIKNKKIEIYTLNKIQNKTKQNNMDPSPITKRNMCSFFATLDDLYSLAASRENTMCHYYSMYCSVPGFATNN